MKNFEKWFIILLSVLSALVLTLIILFAVNIFGNMHSENSQPADSDSDVTNDLGDFTTYFELAYAAYTKPNEYLGKEITLVGYYSDSVGLPDNSSSTEESSEDEESNSGADDELPDDNSSSTVESSDDSSKNNTVYHFLTTYGLIDEVHLTVEFTTKNNKYPEFGTLIMVTGTFTSYTEEGNTYYTITADSYSVV